jgi:hypothetical protein
MKRITQGLRKRRKNCCKQVSIYCRVYNIPLLIQDIRGTGNLVSAFSHSQYAVSHPKTAAFNFEFGYSNTLWNIKAINWLKMFYNSTN